MENNETIEPEVPETPKATKQLSLKKLLAIYLSYLLFCLVWIAIEASSGYNNDISLITLIIMVFLPPFMIITKEEFYNTIEIDFHYISRVGYILYILIVNFIFLFADRSYNIFDGSFWDGDAGRFGYEIEIEQVLFYILWMLTPILINIIIKLFINKKIVFIDKFKERFIEGYKELRKANEPLSRNE